METLKEAGSNGGTPGQLEAGFLNAEGAEKKWNETAVAANSPRTRSETDMLLIPPCARNDAQEFDLVCSLNVTIGVVRRL